MSQYRFKIFCYCNFFVFGW